MRADFLPQLNRAAQIADLQERLAEFRRLSRQYPDAAAVWFNLADDLARDGQLDEARAAVQRAIQREPEIRRNLTPRLAALFAPAPVASPAPAPAPAASPASGAAPPRSAAAPAREPAPPSIAAPAPTMMNPIDSRVGSRVGGYDVLGVA